MKIFDITIAVSGSPPVTTTVHDVEADNRYKASEKALAKVVSDPESFEWTDSLGRDVDWDEVVADDFAVAE